MNETRPAYSVVFLRGLRKRCPRCGRGDIFAAWYTMHDHCGDCGLEYEPEAGSTWAFMYVSTAGITGLIIVAMLLIGIAHLRIWRIVVLPIAILAIGCTLPIRKSLAVGAEYLIRLASDADEPDPTNSTD